MVDRKIGFDEWQQSFLIQINGNEKPFITSYVDVY
jgi:hypothetical protein